MPGNTVRIGTQVTGVGKASSELDRLRDKTAKLSGSNSKMVLGGLAAGAAYGIMAGAGAKVVDILGDAAQAARDDELSQTHLTAALEANTDAFDGNSDAIEEVLASRQRLGFSDDEQRDSLAKLVVATKDVNKALAIQRTAMDLARLKGIGLAEATDALVRIEGGQFRALKAMGIELENNATQTDALAAVQAAAEGQAESYAKTNTGKLLVSQVKVNEAMERLGYVIMPALADATVFLARVTEDLATIASFAEPIWVSLGRAQEESLAKIRALGGEVETVPGKLQKASDAVRRANGMFVEMGEAAEDAGKRVIRSVDEMTDAVVSDADRMSSDFFDPLYAEWDRHDARVELAAAIQKVSTRDIVRSLDDQGAALRELGEDHELSAEEVDRYERDVKRSYKALGRSVPQELQRIISKLYELAGFSGGAVNINVKSNIGGTARQKKAAGGPVSANEPYVVGEEGPEMFVPHSSGSIVPNDKLGGGNTYNIYPQGRWDVGDNWGEAFHAIRRLEAVARGPYTDGRQ